MQERKYPLGSAGGNARGRRPGDHIPSTGISTPARLATPAVFIAGPLFNLVLAFLLYTGVVLQRTAETPFTRVGPGARRTPAAAAGFVVGDHITAVNGAGSSGTEFRRGRGGAAGQPPGRRDPARRGVRRARREPRPAAQATVDTATGAWSVGLEPWNTTVGLVQKGGPADGRGCARATHRVGRRPAGDGLQSDRRRSSTRGRPSPRADRLGARRPAAERPGRRPRRRKSPRA